MDFINLFKVASYFLGFAAVGYLPVALAFGVELTFPMQPVTVNGSMIMCSQGAGFLLSCIITYMTDDVSSDSFLTKDEISDKR